LLEEVARVVGFLPVVEVDSAVVGSTTSRRFLRVVEVDSAVVASTTSQQVIEALAVVGG
jgi:hypothetical protein